MGPYGNIPSGKYNFELRLRLILVSRSVNPRQWETLEEADELKVGENRKYHSECYSQEEDAANLEFQAMLYGMVSYTFCGNRFLDIPVE